MESSTDSTFEDRALVRRLLAGDADSFDEFFDEYFDRLFRFTIRRVNDEVLAEDVVQAAMSDAVRKLSSWRGEGTLFAWLCTFCRHEASAQLERRGRAAVPMTQAGEIQSSEDPHEDASRAQVARHVHEALDELPPSWGNALEWKYIEGMSVREIATRIGVSVKAAESLLTRARDAFRTAFTRRSGELR